MITPRELANILDNYIYHEMSRGIMYTQISLTVWREFNIEIQVRILYVTTEGGPQFIEINIIDQDIHPIRPHVIAHELRIPFPSTTKELSFCRNRIVNAIASHIDRHYADNGRSALMLRTHSIQRRWDEYFQNENVFNEYIAIESEARGLTVNLEMLTMKEVKEWHRVLDMMEF